MDDTAQFFAAVARGDEQVVGVLLAAQPGLARATDADGATALHHAAFAAHPAIVAQLLAAGSEINARDARHDATPAGWALHRLRERGALLAVEIDDVAFALERGDVPWVTRLVTRHPALRTAVDAQGRPLAAHPRVRADPTLAALFAGGAARAEG